MAAANLLGIAGGDLLPSSPLSEAGIEIASSTPGVPFTASVSDWAKVNWSSKVPPARSLRATRLRA